jgi:hypothetical protein
MPHKSDNAASSINISPCQDHPGLQLSYTTAVYWYIKYIRKWGKKAREYELKDSRKYILIKEMYSHKSSQVYGHSKLHFLCKRTCGISLFYLASQ